MSVLQILLHFLCFAVAATRTIYEALFQIIDCESVLESLEVFAKPLQVTFVCFLALLKSNILKLQESVRRDRVYMLKGPAA